MAYSAVAVSWPYQRSMLIFIVLLVAWLQIACKTTEGFQAVDDARVVFDSTQVLKLKFTVSQGNIDRIGNEERPTVPAKMEVIGGKVYERVGIKLKGAAGSYREFDDRPALTVRPGKFQKNQSFHGLDKFHLNNSVQDESYQCELVSSGIFRSAGYPAPRVTYARVWLNDRDVGLYVLKEGFDTKFLEQHFEAPFGNLYDGGFLQDVDVDLEKDEGNGPDDHSDLHAIAEALRRPLPKSRWEALDDLIDIDRFITFMALERMTGHWDGYCLNANNYRLYFDTPSRKAVFLPHGMDQMFGDPEMPLWFHPQASLSAAVMQNDKWRVRYRQRAAELLKFIEPSIIKNRIEKNQRRLQPVLKSISAEAAEHQAAQTRELIERIEARYAFLKSHLEEAEESVLAFDETNRAKLSDWYPLVEAGQAELELVGEVDGQTMAAYQLSLLETNSTESPDSAEPSGPVVASWRRSVLLGPGNYRISARTLLSRLEPAEDQPFGLRLLNNFLPLEHVQSNLGRWTKQVIELEVLEDQREVEFIFELRGKSGQAWIDCDSVAIEKL